MNGKILSLAIIGLMMLGSFGVVGTYSVKNQSFKNLYVNPIDPDEIFDVEEFVPGEVVVGFYMELEDLDPIDVRYIDSFEGHAVKEKIEVLNIAVIEVDEGEEQGFIDSIQDSPFVKYAELNWKVHACYTPNDPRWDAQWGPQRIHCEEAWDSQQGSSSVKIAILDTGVDYTHEDIAGNYVSGGYDWINNDNDPMDDNDHGTHCAGVAAAVMDNNKGIAGVAQVSIMAEKVLNSGGSGSASKVASGITHAADNGADVISMSLSSTTPSSTIENACYYAYNTKGVVIVAAAGNNGKYGVNYPAGHETVIAVGAIDNTDHRCDFSNYGEGLELVAPGKRILSTIIGDDYDYLTGTSMATPHVAGVAALAISEYPDKDNVWIRQKMVDTAEDLGPAGWDEDFGYGLIDARLAEGGPGQWPKVNVKIYKVKELDDIDWPPWPHNDPELYYRASVDSQSRFEYNGYEQQFLFWWIFIWNSESTWIPDKTYSFDAENPEVTVKIKLMEHDFSLTEGFWDDLADVSSYEGWGEDNNIEDKRGAIYQGTYNLKTNELTGDTTDQDGSYLTTSGEYDNNAGGEPDDGNDAKVWFKITDDYDPDDYKPELDVYPTYLNIGNVKKGDTVKRTIKIANNAVPDPFDLPQNRYLNWDIKEQNKPSWVEVNPSSGNLKAGKEEDVTLTIDTSKMEMGYHEGTIKITSNGGNKDIRVTITVPRTKTYHSSFYEFLQAIQTQFPWLFIFLDNFLAFQR